MCSPSSRSPRRSRSPAPAFAGTLQLRDEAHVLSAADAARLRSAGGEAPFDTRVVFTSDYAETQELGRFVGSLVDEPNMVVVGVDPVHRHVQVHFGRAAGIARSEWSAIETAGNADFHSGHWADGAESILRTAARSATGVPVPAGGASSAVPGPGSILVVVLLIGGGVVLLALLARRFMSPPGDAPGYGYGGPGGPGYDPRYGGSGYPGGYGPGPYGPQGGIGPLGAGALGAGLGGLAGYELGKLEGEREGRAVIDDRSNVAPDDGNFDAGGGGSSWDDGGGGGDQGGNDGGGSDF